MSTGDPMWRCQKCGHSNYLANGVSCVVCGSCLTEDCQRYGTPNNNDYDSLVKNIFGCEKSDKETFLKSLKNFVFDQMKEYNLEEEKRISDGKEIKDYVKMSNVIEKLNERE